MPWSGEYGVPPESSALDRQLAAGYPTMLVSPRHGARSKASEEVDGSLSFLGEPGFRRQFLFS